MTLRLRQGVRLGQDGIEAEPAGVLRQRIGHSSHPARLGVAPRREERAGEGPVGEEVVLRRLHRGREVGQRLLNSLKHHTTCV